MISFVSNEKGVVIEHCEVVYHILFQITTTPGFFARFAYECPGIPPFFVILTVDKRRYAVIIVLLIE